MENDAPFCASGSFFAFCTNVNCFHQALRLAFVGGGGGEGDFEGRDMEMGGFEEVEGSWM